MKNVKEQIRGKFSYSSEFIGLLLENKKIILINTYY